MKSGILVFIIFVIFAFITYSNAQEIQVPLLPQKHIDYIDAALQKKINLFNEYEHFLEARIFQLPDSSYVLEILYRAQGKTFQQRKPITMEEIRQLRQTILTRLESQRKHALDQKGRTKLLIASTTLSLGYYGWVVPMALNVNSEKQLVALYMLTGSAGIMIPYWATKSRPVSNAAATMAIYGATRGILHGYLLAHTFEEDPSVRRTFTTSMLVSIGEGFAGYRLATNKHYSTGRVETMSVTGDFGMLLGSHFAYLAHYFNDNIGTSASASILAGAGLGVWAGKLLSDQYTYSRGDARILEACALLGAYAPLAMVDLTGTNNGKIYAGASMLGTLTGIGLAHYLLKNKNFTYGQGLFTELGEIAGGLLSFGLAYLVTPTDNADKSKIYLTASSVGAGAGFWLMYHSFAKKALIKTSSSSSVRFNLHPESLLGLMIKNNKKEMRLPLANFQFVF